MRRRLAYLAGLLLVVLTATGIAVAASRSGEVAAVSGDISAQLVGAPDVRQCGAPEDNTFRIRATFEGTVTSSDPRLAGDLELRTVLVGDNDTGDGVVRAHVRVRDQDTGRLKLVGSAVGATTGLTDFRVQGVLEATLIPGGGELVANTTVSQDPTNLSLTGEFGKDTPVAPSNKAVVNTTVC
jgi:hypothetical protein